MLTSRDQTRHAVECVSVRGAMQSMDTPVIQTMFFVLGMVFVTKTQYILKLS